MQQENQRKNIMLAVMFAIAVVLVLIGYFAYTSITRSGKVAVDINVVPSDAKVSMNDTPISPGKAYLEPGTYTIKASKEGFEDYTKQTVIETDGQIISIPMIAVSDEAKKWVQENQKSYQDLEAQAGQDAIRQGEEFTKKNPITTLLPYDSLLYTIGYRADNSDPSGNSIILEIDAIEGYRQQAIYQIRQWGYDPTDFKINFNEYENPFKS